MILLVFLLVLPIALSVEEGIYFYHNDRLGSPRVITDSKGGIVWISDYEDFGKPVNEKGESDYKYTGKELDENTGLYYYGARYYDPETGRFVSADKIETFPNPYVYGKNNPFKYVDPIGNVPVGISIGDKPEEHERSKLDLLYSNIKGGIKKIDELVTTGYHYSMTGETALHEASHAFAFEAFGVDIEEIKVTPTNIPLYDQHGFPIGEMRALGYVSPESESFMKNIGESKIKRNIVSMAPYAFDILVQHRIYESLYRHDKIKEGGMVDAYIKTTVYLDVFHVKNQASAGGDIAKFAESAGINKHVVTAALTGLYAYSAYRVYKQAEKAEGIMFIGTEFKW